MYYRERTNFWWEKVAATPDANSQRALYLEVAKSYERLAARSEQREPPPISGKSAVVGRLRAVGPLNLPRR